MSSDSKNEMRVRRHRRLRKRVSGTSTRPRMSVFRSLSHIYVQIIDDEAGHTLVNASTLDASIQKGSAELTKSELARKVGELAAERAIDKKIEQVVFDRGGYRYFGRVKALADGARDKGLKF